MEQNQNPFADVDNLNSNDLAAWNIPDSGKDKHDKQNVEQYNEGQTKIINAPFDHQIVGVAGAGTGKTTTIIARAVKALNTFKDGNLILITFTRLAAQDLRDRIADQVSPDDAKRIIVGTFHSVISRVIRQNATAVGLDPEYTIIDEASSNSMYKMAINGLSEEDQAWLKRYFGKLYKLTKNDRKALNFPREFTTYEDIMQYLMDNPDDSEMAEWAETIRQYIKDRSAKEIDSSFLKLIVNAISHLINTASGEELQSSEFNLNTIKRVCASLNGKRYYLDGDPNNIRDFSVTSDKFKTKYVSILYRIFLQSIKLSQTTNTLNYDQILFIGYLMTLPRDGETLLDEFKRDVSYVIVDEYQDTNYLQDSFINAITDSNLTVVGDIDQSIYEFRGGTVKLIADRAAKAKAEDPNNVINLTENYRSFQPILDAANHLIEVNTTGQATRKPLSAVRKDPNESKVRTCLIEAASPSDEAKQVLNRVQELQDQGVSYNDIAILIRSRLVLPTLKSKLQENKIPLNDTTHYADVMDSETMADVLDFLKILTNPKDIYAFRAILDKPKKGLGPQKLELLQKLAAQNGMSEVEFLLSDKLIQFAEAGQKSAYKKLKDFADVYQNILATENGALDYTKLAEIDTEHEDDPSALVVKTKEILKATKYDAWVKKQKNHNTREEYLKQIYDIMRDFEDNYKLENDQYTLLDLANAFLAQSQDFVKSNDENGLVIATVHGAKGLEWQHVIIVGMDRNIFPSAKAVKNGELESERRLAYVALTRGRNSVYMTHSATRLGDAKYDLSQFAEKMIQDHDNGKNELKVIETDDFRELEAQENDYADYADDIW